MDTIVIGIVFLDIKGFPFAAYDRRGTNLGSILMTQGGVARNVAENLANLGQDVSFVSMFDAGAMGQEAKTRLSNVGVKLEHSVSVPEKGMGMWLAVFNENSDLDGSISQMPDPDALEKLFDEKGDEIIKNAKNIVLEMDVSEKLTRRVFALAEKYNKDVYTIVANMKVILACPDLMAKTACVILNEIEASRLLRMSLQHLTPSEMMTSAFPAAKAMGIRRMIITMGENGAVFMDAEAGIADLCAPIPTKVKDTTGAGDAFFSAAVAALSEGMTLAAAAERGARLASLTLSTSESACPRVGARFLSQGADAL